VLLAEELVLVAMRPETGRHRRGYRSQLNACLAGLLVGELQLDPGASSSSPLLAAAAEVAAEKGPKLTSVLSHMDRGLQRRLGLGTWDAVVAGVAPYVRARGAVVAWLREAAAGDGPVDLRTALLLSMTGPANLLEVVAPGREGRRQARRRIDHAVDGTPLEPVAKAVRKVIADAVAAAAVGTVA
jgi:hypothetical protein